MAIETVTTLDFSVLFVPIFKFIIVLFAVVGGYATVNNFMHIFARYGKDKLDNDLIEKLTEKDVKIITVENSKDIHELTKRIEKLEEVIKCK